MSIMSDPSAIVRSAASSFNNAAIAAPSFFWSALLALPLFALAYMFGNDFIARLKLSALQNPGTRAAGFALCAQVVLLAWLILMSGDYAVLRDAASVLPYAISGVLFVLSASIVQNLRTLDPQVPQWYQKLKYKRYVLFAAFLIIAAAAGFAGAPTWWGFLMNAAAVLCGMLAGRAWRRFASPVLPITVVIFALTAIILMQPEFFRFGQLGNLTALHIIFVLLTGMLAAAVVAVRNIRPRGGIHRSAFVKLKWMCRIVTGLCLIMFVLTESVPVFFGAAAALAAMFAISVWHARGLPEYLSEKLWAALLCSFGIMASLPAITALGVAYWAGLPKSDVPGQSKFLL